MGYRTILLPTDGSAPAERATAEALDLAAEFGATVHALSVVDSTALTMGSLDEEGGFDYEVGPLLDAMEASGERTTAAVRDAGAERGVEVVTAVVDGTPAREILDYADGHGVDLIVMGTRGRRGLDRYLLGSTTERVLRRASVPVLTVRYEADDRGE